MHSCTQNVFSTKMYRTNPSRSMFSITQGVNCVVQMTNVQGPESAHNKSANDVKERATEKESIDDEAIHLQPQALAHTGGTITMENKLAVSDKGKVLKVGRMSRLCKDYADLGIQHSAICKTIAAHH